MNHCSTVQERVSMVSQMLATPMYGLVSQLGRSHQVARQTLYRWAATGRQALEEALGNTLLPPKQTETLPPLVLTQLIETHASYRGIQTCLRDLHGMHLSLGRIVGIVKEAGQRARRWLSQQQAGTPRALALDEQYSSQRGKAYLNVVDVHSGQVWATVPPVEVDGESWTLLLWYLQEQGISRSGTVSDGGRAIQEALSQVHGQEDHQRDVWHLFHVAAQVQGRLDRAVQAEQDRLFTIQRQAAALANGIRRRGRRPKAPLAEQEACLSQMSYVADGVRYLCQELHTLLEVVVPLPDGLLTSEHRQGEIVAVLGPTSEHLLQSIHPAWRAVASHLLAAWDQAVRASSAVENWHSIVRPHLAAHRKLSAGLLSLLAVWHNHRIAPRGPHEGLSPLQRTESTSSTHHWLAALGYAALAA